ncbi:hypothetical protein CASFOL_031958 [Castilleja foliolosa]
MSLLSKLRLVTVDVTGTLIAYKGELGDYYCMAAKSIGLPCLATDFLLHSKKRKIKQISRLLLVLISCPRQCILKIELYICSFVKWSKGKQKKKVNNLVLFDKSTYDKLLSEAPKYKLITPSVLSDRLREAVDDLMVDTHELGGSAVVVDRATPKENDYRPISRVPHCGGGGGGLGGG